MKHFFLLVAFVGLCSASLGQCNAIAVTNYTAATLDIGGQAVVPVLCPPAGFPEMHTAVSVAPSATVMFTATPGKEFYRVGANSFLGMGSSTAPDWAFTACATVPVGPYTMFWYSTPSGVCKVDIY